ncbi:recombinase family protein [Dactylosporangium sucinum]|uniref:Resolvase n=1 Tax=Dactylosporangium sucinum TaxID=1424081 RepID=A0A917UGA7_9ACTN|nr:recombinase family protein [Dactylosporangium sucinum]GGM90711.1 resolvase [Dactylosporangium sucinum]
MTRAANPRLRAVPEQPLRAIIYVRQSISRDDSVSLELQETAARDYAARRGYNVIDVVSDPGRTGTTLKRRQVTATIARIENREADIIIVWRWSRLSRSRRDFAVVCDMVESVGGRIESATEPIDTSTASGRFARGMMAEFAAYESELKSEVWKEVHARRRNNGTPAQGGQRYGYIHQAGTNTYDIDPITGPILADMYRRFIDGAGGNSIAAWLNREGIPNRIGRPWRADVVRRLLDSGFGAGLVTYGKATKTGMQQWAVGVHPAVITDDEWKAYRRARGVKTRPPEPSEAKYMLTGLIRCGDCGFPMHPTKLGVRTGYGYVCSKWAQTHTCRCVTVTRSKVERAAYLFLKDLATDIDSAGERQRAASERRVVLRSETQDLSRRIARADERLVRLTSGWTEGLVPDAAYRATRDEIEELKARLEQQLAAAESATARVPARPSVPPGLLQAWPSMPAARQRAVLRGLIDRMGVLRPPGESGVRGGRSRVRVEILSTWGETYYPLESE